MKITYYEGINAVEYGNLEIWLIEFISKNRIKIVGEGKILVTSRIKNIKYEIKISYRSTFMFSMSLYKNRVCIRKDILNEEKNYKNCGEIFIEQLVLLKKMTNQDCDMINRKQKFSVIK